jgi:thioredoxin-related protein
MVMGLLAVTLATAGTEAPTAQRLVDNAKARASAQHKTILLLFGASWCPWCKRLDSFIETSNFRPIFARHFVIARIDVQEHADKVGLDTPGGAELEKQLGSRSNGLPFFAFLNERGELVANSNRPLPGKSQARNIGYPMEPIEVDYFMNMLKKVAPPFSPAESQRIEKYLRNQKR